MKALKILSSDLIEELARFWDSHDLTQFNDELEEVRGHVFKRAPARTVAVRLRPAEAEAVKRVAKTKRVGEATLIRRWVIEKLHATSLAAKRR